MSKTHPIQRSGDILSKLMENTINKHARNGTFGLEGTLLDVDEMIALAGKKRETSGMKKPDYILINGTQVMPLDAKLSRIGKIKQLSPKVIGKLMDIVNPDLKGKLEYVHGSLIVIDSEETRKQLIKKVERGHEAHTMLFQMDFLEELQKQKQGLCATVKYLCQLNHGSLQTLEDVRYYIDVALELSRYNHIRKSRKSKGTLRAVKKVVKEYTEAKDFKPTSTQQLMEYIKK